MQKTVTQQTAMQQTVMQNAAAPQTAVPQTAVPQTVQQHAVMIGRIQRGELSLPFQQTAAVLRDAGMACCVNPPEPVPAGFLFFFQSYPHEFSPELLRGWRQTAPLAPRFFILGTCCEGMMRTAPVMDSPFYSYAHRWNRHGGMPDYLRTICRTPLASAPVSSPVSAAYPADSETQDIYILPHFGPFGNDPAMNLLLAERYGRDRCQIIPAAKIPPFSGGAIIADTDDSPPELILPALRHLRSQFIRYEITLYVHSPRFHEKQALHLAGAAAVLDKHFWD